MKWKHFFVPHSETHKPAYLISKTALLVYIFLFLTFNLSISIVEKVNSTILGIAADLNTKELIRLTNVEREKMGLSVLQEDSRLDQAAMEKAKNMFAENYWAHYSPSGKDPWGFIMGAGYKFSYAGENLARNFYHSNDVVEAWMASPTHKDNVVNMHYQNIGMAVMEGTLNGQPTVLVVQEFGSPVEYLAEKSSFKKTIAQASPTPEGTSQPIESPEPTVSPPLVVAVEGSAPPNFPTTVAGQKTFALDPYLLIKNLGVSLIVFLMFLIALDLYIIRRRAVIRLTANHWPRLAVLLLGLSVLINLGRGTVV